jgi:hypothetical protein
MLEYSLHAQLAFHDEPLVGQAVDQLLTGVVLMLDSVAPRSKQLGLQRYRDDVDSDSLASLRSTTGRPLRPGFQMRAKNGLRLIYQGAERAAGAALQEAVAELQVKAQAREALVL